MDGADLLRKTLEARWRSSLVSFLTSVEGLRSSLPLEEYEEVPDEQEALEEVEILASS